MLRIGMLTSGGDCQALNAAMRGVVKVIQNNCKEPYEIYGFEDGYKGLIYGHFRMLTGADFSGILTRGGKGCCDEADLLQASAGLPGNAGRQWLDQDGKPSFPGRPECHHASEDHRQ